MRRFIEPSHLDLCCLQKLIIIVCGSERVKQEYLMIILGHLYPPILRGGEHIDFGADPVGVRVGVGVTLSCLYNIL